MFQPVPQPATQSAQRRGFTLIELMIVMVVIAILIGLALPAINSAKRTVKIAAVKNEIGALERAIAEFEATFGKQPPSSMVLYENGAWKTGAALSADEEVARRNAIDFIQSAWPQFNWTATYDLNHDGDSDDILVLNGAECLFFCLGGILDSSEVPTGFSKNPATPFQTSGANRVGPFYEFKLSRLTDLDDDHMHEYKDSLSGQTSPFMYFSSYAGRGYKAADLNLIGMTRWYHQKNNVKTYWKPKSFQLFSPGFDAEYGTGGKYDPDTASSDLVGTRLGERDNITNFAEGGTLAD